MESNQERLDIARGLWYDDARKIRRGVKWRNNLFFEWQKKQKRKPIPSVLAIVMESNDRLYVSPIIVLGKL